MRRGKRRSHSVKHEEDVTHHQSIKEGNVPSAVEEKEKIVGVVQGFYATLAFPSRLTHTYTTFYRFYSAQGYFALY
jgi:hypothetical protein